MNDAPIPLPKNLIPSRGETCQACRCVWMEGNELVCRRYPPTVQIILVPAPAPRVGQMMAQQMAMLPPTRPDGWCGEFSPAYNARQ
jgi:hypothetical protein